MFNEKCRTFLAAGCRTILGQVPNCHGQDTESSWARCRTVLDGAEVSRCRSVQVPKCPDTFKKDRRCRTPAVIAGGKPRSRPHRPSLAGQRHCRHIQVMATSVHITCRGDCCTHAYQSAPAHASIAIIRVLFGVKPAGGVPIALTGKSTHVEGIR
ncbi:hypothetical protein Bbelb_076590 [Branchiostoma belcheri]|nr:hypothetical protein Bbelb_076590 [Branchiostoma belcheri]